MAEAAGALHCENCGAPASPGDRVCSYCQAPIVAATVPGASICPRCGGPVAPGEGCPRCTHDPTFAGHLPH